jgi:hypothetical protein
MIQVRVAGALVQVSEVGSADLVAIEVGSMTASNFSRDVSVLALAVTADIAWDGVRAVVRRLRSILLFHGIAVLRRDEALTDALDRLLQGSAFICTGKYRVAAVSGAREAAIITQASTCFVTVDGYIAWFVLCATLVARCTAAFGRDPALATRACNMLHASD